MESQYNLEHLAAQAQSWRNVAEQAPSDCREIYVSRAIACETRMQRSLDTPAIQVRQTAMKSLVMLALATASAVAVSASPALAGLVFTLTQDGCTGTCGTGPLGTITVS